MSIRVFVCGFDKETYRAKSVVARNHRGLFVFHPAVKEVHATVGERHDEGGEGFPGAVAETFWLLPAVCDKNGSFLQVACVLDGVLVLFHEVLVASLANDCNLDFFHSVKDRFLDLAIVHSFEDFLCHGGGVFCDFAGGGGVGDTLDGFDEFFAGM